MNAPGVVTESDTELRAALLAELEDDDLPFPDALEEDGASDPEYLEFMRRKVEKARISMREGRGRPNEEVEAYFAARRARSMATLEPA